MIALRPLHAAALAGSLLLALPSAQGHVSASEPVRYDRDIRPLLSDRCFTCHGPDEAKRKARLRLDDPASAFAEREGRAALVPGAAASSEVWARVTSADPDERMPPPDGNKRPLSKSELDLLRRWIDEGALYEEHWSFVPPVRPPSPAVEDAGWCRGEVDAFVLSELERRGIAPSPEADRRTLLRRVFLDLTGLPPTPEELAAFLADDRPDAYERQVERLLHEEPYVSRYAERMAVPWLDAARYADTSGIHMDAGRQIWPWRDWVLAAFRDGMPFDRFLTEQLAGDLLPGATTAQKVASGFNRNHVTTDEGGAIDAEYLVEYAVDRTATTGSVFLGLTLGCARCHDHKYDPVTQEEFFSLYSYFNSIEEPGLYSQVPDAKRALEPFLVVPSLELEAEIEGLTAQLERARAERDEPAPGEDDERAAFLAARLAEAGVEWIDAFLALAGSDGDASIEVLDDGSVLFGGANPDTDTHVFELELAGGAGLRLLALEALTDPRLPFADRVGRAPNGNAVLDYVSVEVAPASDPQAWRQVPLAWAWADHEQRNGDFRVVNALVDDDGIGWAVQGHERPGPRAALFLAHEPFGFADGTLVRVRLEYDSQYAQHVLGRVRLSVGRLAEAGLDALPLASSGWYATAPYAAASGQAAFETAFGPESMAELDTTLRLGEEQHSFNFIELFQDERLNTELAGGINATYVAKRLFVPDARTVEVSLGSDDGYRLFLDGAEVGQKQVDRGLAPDQDRETLELSAGVHTVVLKVVNTGGVAGYWWKLLPRERELVGDLTAALLPDRARWDGLEQRLRTAWRLAFSPSYRERSEAVVALEQRLDEAQAGVPRTMVMKERAERRPTYVLERGVYDHPDESRPVGRGVPAALGALPAGAPDDRRGLALWLCAPENPLVARVAVNRLWELCFGTGLVATSEDFGMQGAWPSHPELLDWLAVEYRESGWDTKAMLARLVTSSTYRQGSRLRPELAELDPDGRLLSRYPRRRLGAEQIRDQALYVSGLLVEAFGGPSVKPYQPEGLWREVAMPQSNTREYERGMGDDLWRRSLYTYWKRAAPPPAMLTFDAPTREFCTIRRGETATPLQALVLWNDEQFVEAARVLAERTLTELDEDAARLARMFERCTGREPDAAEAAALAAALADFRARYAAAPEDAERLLELGEHPRGELPAEELAAWALLASGLFSLDATLSQG